ncbi:MAG: sporulation protein YqfD [Clostridiales bacterium]|jgi:similar to stage IV sporulation protein|nr:sporulation protein YqfD [Clostridiales bacterium]
MLLVQLVNFIRGYAEILIEGIFPERFLNLCARRGIYLWNVRRAGKLSVSANVSARGFKMLRPIARKSRCSVRVRTRRGLPFFTHKHRKRKAFLLGAALFGVMLFVMTRFIWVIEITGGENLPREELLTALAAAGLKPGVAARAADTDAIEREMMTRRRELAWIGITIQGTTARVNVREREEAPAIFPKDEPCDIVAATDGVIEAIDATNGGRQVSAGDVVRAGQVLISGTLESASGAEVRYVHADGEVLARTWHEFYVEIPRYEEVKTRTGRAKSKHMLKIFNFYIKFFINDGISYTNYDRISSVKNLSVGESIVLPFSFHYDKYYEVEVTMREAERGRAVELAAAGAHERVRGLQIIDLRREETEDGLRLTYECLENIAQKREITR